MKYNILNRAGQVIKGITIDGSARMDFMVLMGWDAEEWKRNTKLKR